MYPLRKINSEIYSIKIILVDDELVSLMNMCIRVLGLGYIIQFLSVHAFCFRILPTRISAATGLRSQ